LPATLCDEEANLQAMLSADCVGSRCQSAASYRRHEILLSDLGKL
jgi:hypothetical protein